MSNRRRLKAAGSVPAERCTSCGHRIGRLDGALRLRTGQVICPRCRQHGTPQRLSCGHYVPPGSLMINDNGDGKTYRCVRCSPEAAQFGSARLGMGSQ